MFGWRNYVEKKEGLRFPLADKERCTKWTAAVRREAWQPNKFATSILSQVGLQGLTDFSGFTRYALEIVVLKTFLLHELLLSIYSRTLNKIAEYVHWRPQSHVICVHDCIRIFLGTQPQQLNFSQVASFRHW